MLSAMVSLKKIIFIVLFTLTVMTNPDTVYEGLKRASIKLKK